MIQGIDHVAIFVTDMERAKQFYTDVLDLELGFESPHWTVVITDGVYIGLHPAEKVVGHGSGAMTTQVSFKVRDIEETQEKLKELGVVFTREVNEISPGKWLSNFCDPDGNLLSIYEEKA